MRYDIEGNRRIRQVYGGVGARGRDAPPTRSKCDQGRNPQTVKSPLQIAAGRRRRRQWHVGSAMARVATDMHFAIGELGVDVVHHLDHEARRGLLRVFVAGEIRWHVAEATVLTKTKRGGEGTHGRNEIAIRRQDFQVLWSRHPLFLRRILWRCNQQKKGYGKQQSRQYSAHGKIIHRSGRFFLQISGQKLSTLPGRPTTRRATRPLPCKTRTPRPRQSASDAWRVLRARTGGAPRRATIPRCRMRPGAPASAAASCFIKRPAVPAGLGPARQFPLKNRAFRLRPFPDHARAFAK
jgi:hypothetical protein